MAFSIDEFSSNMSAYGWSKTNLFDVNFTLPPLIQLAAANGSSQIFTQISTPGLPTLLRLRSQHVSQPATVLEDIPANIYGMGPKKRQPYNAIYTPLTMEFICDRNGLIHTFFYSWMNAIYNFSETVDASGTTVIIPNYTVNYNDDIVSPTVVVNKYSLTGDIETITNYYKIKPVGMKASDLNWAETDALFKLSVSFVFLEWSMVIPSFTSQPSFETSSTASTSTAPGTSIDTGVPGSGGPGTNPPGLSNPGISTSGNDVSPPIVVHAGP